MNSQDVSRCLRIVSKTISAKNSDDEDEKKFTGFVEELKYTSNGKPFNGFHWFVYPLTAPRSYRLDFYCNSRSYTINGKDEFMKSIDEIEKLKKEYEIRKKKIEEYAKKNNLNVRF